ncbi:hypothetical protein DNU06_09890 [Putridiphycobacter roseus]|uniref:Uncharacterized protein n=2 Tax=Putridiphycobacter roseus TaxID=2219161 RepID=A0A2W1N0L0_9FLAO|nr:hypothetical protein DNU06_09890 [Putridiphycobacter roseus]
MSLLTAKADLSPLYTIQEKSMQSALSKDSLYLEGKVSYTTKPGPESFGQISSLDLKTTKVFARNGNYKIVIPRSAKGIFFFQSGYQEVVINLKEYSAFNHFKINIIAKENRAVIMVEKPVIYLYSSEPVETNLTLKPKGALAFTYPKYNDGWHIRTQKNGEILNLATKKKHPYLFWEAKQTNVHFQEEDGKITAFVMDTDTVISFLETQLHSLGLNARESTDFITYWAPRLQVKKYATVQFLIQEEYNDLFGTIQSSMPIDYQLRIGMLFEVSDRMPNIAMTTPTFNHMMERNGFTLIEWGGAEIQNGIPSL